MAFAPPITPPTTAHPLLTTTFTSRATSRRAPRTAPARSTPRMLVLPVGSVAELDSMLETAEDSLVVVDFSTTWCGPCKVIAPIFEEMSERYDDVVFAKVMGDESPEASEIMQREGIRAVPAFHFWRKGEKLQQFSGSRAKDVENAIITLK